MGQYYRSYPYDPFFRPRKRWLGHRANDAETLASMERELFSRIQSYGEDHWMVQRQRALLHVFKQAISQNEKYEQENKEARRWC